MGQFSSRLAVAVLSGAAVAGGFFGGAALLDHVQFARAESQVEVNRQALSQVEDLSSVFRAVNKVVEPSVVKIDVTKTVKVSRGDMPDEDLLRQFFQDNGQPMPNIPAPDNQDNQGGQEFEQDGTGSGVIMETADGYGYILTNYHVAGEADDIKVTLADGRIFNRGHLMGADKKSDLAVVRIKADNLIPARWGNSDDLQKGDWILAFGCPLGYAGTMTHGIVSALDREHVGIIDNGNGYEDFIQVDAPINPGNSGGPLVNLHGDVVGINTAIASSTGQFSGIGLAIPINNAHKVYDALKGGGKIVRGWLGVSIRDIPDVDPQVVHSFGFTKDQGVFVWGLIKDTPAYGILKAGDIITAIDGKPVNTSEQLRSQIGWTAPGSNVKLTIFRDGKTMDVNIKLGTQPGDDELAQMNSNQLRPGGGRLRPSSTQQLSKLGLQIEDLTPTIADQLGYDKQTTGAVITRVTADSIAAKAGLKTGMVITQVGRTDITSASGAAAALGNVDLAKGVRLTVQSLDEGSAFVFLQQDDNSPSNN
ncbi:MAG: trypsin-like peptidase domain-containing protein [Tepidisphaeraceae bacterium]|jgi:serine protease Do